MFVNSLAFYHLSQFNGLIKTGINKWFKTIFLLRKLVRIFHK